MNHICDASVYRIDYKAKMKQHGPASVLILMLLCMPGGSFFAQEVFGEAAFRNMPDAERFRFVHSIPFPEMDSAALTKAFGPMFEIAAEKNDRRSLLALQYHKFQERRKLKLTEKTTWELLSDMEAEARKVGFNIEKTVAHHFAVFEQFYQKKLPHEQLYVEILREFERMEALGFEQFREYDIARILFHSGSFMFNLEDFEKALQYLTVAERFIQPTEPGRHTYTLVLNHIQTIFQRQKNYPKGIEYAQKILQFSRALQTNSAEIRRQCRIWQGIASIDIASMLVEQGNFAEGENYANEGYKLVKADEHGAKPDLWAEYDALQVLISTKLELGKRDEAADLLHRVDEINEKAGGSLTENNYFKHIRFYQSYARLYEMKGDYAAAIRYTNLARPLQDSLNRRNDARKFERIQQRLAAEKYTEQLQLVEKEKQLQTWLRNAAIVILLLVLALAYVHFRRLQHNRRQKEAELQAARNDLESLTRVFREKSELSENLRLENEKLSRHGERSEYLEQLTRATILTDDDWMKFRAVFEKVHPEFIIRQKEQFPDLTPAETRLLALEKLDLSTQEMANMLGVNKNTIHQTRLRMRRKTAGV